MVMKAGECWHCTNAACGCSIVVQTSGEIEGKNPLCVCGSAMKKQYSPPIFQYLDFLRFPDPVPAGQDSRED